MFGLIHEMRSRIITSPVFTGDKVIGAILFERTMDGQIDGKPVPQVLTERGVVPFIKIDKGLEDEANGVQLMKPMPELDALLSRAKGLGVFGTKERSVINLANREGIAAVVAQQFEVGQQVLAAGLVPIIEPEVNIKSAERAEADQILLEELTKALDAMPGDDKVMLKLSIPAKAGLFQPLVDHPRVLRVVALSGGFSRTEACRELAKNRRHDRQLLARSADGPAPPDERCRIRRRARRGDRRNLPGIDRKGADACSGASSPGNMRAPRAGSAASSSGPISTG